MGKLLSGGRELLEVADGVADALGAGCTAVAGGGSNRVAEGVGVYAVVDGGVGCNGGIIE